MSEGDDLVRAGASVLQVKGPSVYIPPMPVHVTSEIGRLRAVLVHTPGAELLAVTPDTRADYLYDDIIDVESARREHDRFVAVLERFAEVLHVRRLLLDIIDLPDVRELILREVTEVVPSNTLAREMAELPGSELVTRLIEGREDTPGHLASSLNECGYALPPLPNLYFTRDVAMAIGRHVLIGSMRYGVRWSEELIMKALFSHHPALANDGILYDGSIERRTNYTLEGGDVHPLRPDTVLIGFSDRSSPAAIDQLVKVLFENAAIENVVVIVMPREKTAIHLDMIFTHVDHELCVIHPPHFLGPERLSVLLWRRGQSQLREMPTVFAALAQCGLHVEPIFCGGSRRITQEREQWASGCNFVALRPGVVTSYSRNHATLDELQKFGFRIVPAAALLTGETRIAEGERAAITFEGGELVRGGGGPRCMTCPVMRDDV